MTLPKGDNPSLKAGNEKVPFVQALTLDEIQRSELCEDLVDVLKFGNRAIAHHEPNDIDHSFVGSSEDWRLIRVINYIEEQIIIKVYGDRQRYQQCMSLPNNEMHRDRFNLKTCL